MGAIFAQKFARTTPEAFAAWKRRNTCTLVGTSPSAETDYQAMTYPKPVMLLMGSERKGLSEEIQALCDVVVKIPMVGRSDSLNLLILIPARPLPRRSKSRWWAAATRSTWVSPRASCSTNCSTSAAPPGESEGAASKQSARMEEGATALLGAASSRAR
jgi:hypothetical protein